MGVILVDLDLVNAATVLLEGDLHDLGLAANSPEASLTFLTTGEDALAIVGGSKGGYTVVVRVVNSV